MTLFRFRDKLVLAHYCASSPRESANSKICQVKTKQSLVQSRGGNDFLTCKYIGKIFDVNTKELKQIWSPLGADDAPGDSNSLDLKELGASILGAHNYPKLNNKCFCLVKAAFRTDYSENPKTFQGFNHLSAQKYFGQLLYL
jgi:hypothetical protein